MWNCTSLIKCLSTPNPYGFLCIDFNQVTEQYFGAASMVPIKNAVQRNKMDEYALLAKSSYEYSQGGERVEQERDHGKEFHVDLFE